MRNLVPVILSGGSGTRLWPASRKSLPKQFKKFSNIGTLFSQTLNRVKELNNCNNLTVVSAREYEFLINNEIERHNLRGTLILEELSKNTAAAIFLLQKVLLKVRKILSCASCLLIIGYQILTNLK